MLWATLPLLFGLAVTTVASGSMEPRISTGDVVAALPVAEDALRDDQVILFEDPAVPDRLRLHRIIELSKAGIETQGDANPEPDSMLVAPEAVVGVGFLRVPYLGVPVNWLHEGQWLKLALFLGALGSAALLSGLDRDLRVRDRIARGPRHSGPSSGPLGAMASSKFGSSLIPLTATVLVAVTVAYLVGGSAASAAFASKTTAGSSFTAAEFFETPWEQASFHWPYSEGLFSLNSALDDTGNRRNGNLVGMITRPSEGGNPYVSLDGSTAQISSARLPGAAPNSFTMETWFKTTTTRGGKLMGYGNSQTGASTTADRHLYMANGGKLYFGAISGTQRLTVGSSASYNDGRWHLATVTMDPAAGSVLYVDGARVASSASMVRGSALSDGYWRVGYDTIDSTWPDRPTSNRYAGGLDGTSVYPFPLSSAAVAQHYSYGR